MIRYAKIALAAATLVAAVPASAADYVIDATKATTATAGIGNTFTFKVAAADGNSFLNVKASAWVRGFDGSYTAAELTSSASGFGINQTGESATYAGIDNASGWEFLVLQFDQDVSLQSAMLNPTSLGTVNPADTDAFVARAMGSFTSAMTGAVVKGFESGYDPTKQSGATYFNSDSTTYNGSTTQTLNSGQANNMLMIGASMNGPDSNQDAFKLNMIKVTSSVPEPTTWMTMILGFGMIGAAVRRRRGAGKAVAA